MGPDTATRLYAALPASLQDAAITVAGIRSYRERYGGTFREVLASLKLSEWWDAEEIATYQRNRLAIIVGHAFANVPYYRRVFNEIGADPCDIRSAADLSRLPILTKELVRSVGVGLRSTAPLGRLRLSKTSGTTGTPVTIWKTAHADRFQWAVWWRHRSRFGLQLGDRFLTFGAKVPSLSPHPRPPIWRTDYAIGQSYIPVSHLLPSFVPAVVDWINQKRFRFFAGYPTAMRVLAQEMIERGLRFQRPPGVVCCGSESLCPELVGTLTEAFQSRVTELYGMGESAAGFAECERGRLHADCELGIVELLPIPGQPPTSSLRRIVCTGLQNLAMPFLRYEVGDYAHLAPGPCPCGRHSPTVASIEGRLDEHLLTPDGRRVFGVNQVFKLARHVKEAQVVQESMRAVVLRLVPASTYDGSDERRLVDELRLRLGPDVSISVSLVGRIDRAASGKFIAVVPIVGRFSDGNPTPS